MALKCHKKCSPQNNECEYIPEKVFLGWHQKSFGIPDISSRIDQSTMYGHTILNMYIEDVCSNQNLL